LAAALLVPATASADHRKTRFDVGLGISVGAFGVSGEFAEENRAEGGPEVRIPFHVRVFNWEGEANIAFRSGASDGMFEEYSASGMSFRIKRFQPIGYIENRRGNTWLHFEGYVRGSIDRMEFNRVSNEPVMGLGYGAGLQARLQGGSRRGKAAVSYAAFVDLGRVHFSSTGDEPGGGSATVQSITFGFILLGIGG
jgi:hypothetical protein